jgi:hypothetical protein
LKRTGIACHIGFNNNRAVPVAVSLRDHRTVDPSVWAEPEDTQQLIEGSYPKGLVMD